MSLYRTYKEVSPSMWLYRTYKEVSPSMSLYRTYKERHRGLQSDSLFVFRLEAYQCNANFNRPTSLEPEYTIVTPEASTFGARVHHGDTRSQHLWSQSTPWRHQKPAPLEPEYTMVTPEASTFGARVHHGDTRSQHLWSQSTPW